VKKLKCSRELPKCSNCQKWPGSCGYSHVSQPRKKRITPSPSERSNLELHPQLKSSVPIEERLYRMEESIECLKNVVQTLVRRLDADPTNQKPVPFSRASEPPNSEGSSIPSSVPDIADAFSPFSQASIDLESVKPAVPSGYQHGSESLKELSEAFSAVHFDGDKVRQDAMKASRSREFFYIPTVEEGQFLQKG
jgi:Zn(2)-Cys(6) binuclear cluster domain-containing protein